MNKLIFSTVFTIAIASSVPDALAGGVLRDAKASHLVHSGAHPNNARLSATHHFEVHVQGGDLSQLTIDVPKGMKVSDRIVVTDESGKKIDNTISVNDRKIAIAFSQPIRTGTTLSVSMKGVRSQLSLLGRVWLYPVYARKTGMTEDIRIGMARIQTY
ncbi:MULTISPECIES: DUF2808 domain-containing protein [Cyanophyceae]|uniref:DUF2808 domain-containing protein n=1 Tax=Cyanophyceae TaxID=3028117 RepID=UPI0002A675B7|nr:MULTISPECIES: DUF2808 domain-containing protein [Cyanophyceae]AFZ33454.1 hypothetical protein Glo7428_5067 [Gloeocapsa sp. PCC 7428]PIG91637.1 DUF2808 domain-containing protein [Gloeocapsopsis sp. IPPAS B-1203]PPS41965.1 hypothetical protein B1A85_15965 [Chroococcidiopsis sp. TS-821]